MTKKELAAQANREALIASLNGSKVEFAGYTTKQLEKFVAYKKKVAVKVARKAIKAQVRKDKRAIRNSCGYTSIAQTVKDSAIKANTAILERMAQDKIDVDVDISEIVVTPVKD